MKTENYKRLNNSVKNTLVLLVIYSLCIIIVQKGKSGQINRHASIIMN